jgi:S-DNA-T family DNA segregation ATPase FtsK/SpoIIIE
MAMVGRRATTELRLVAVRPDGVAADLLVEAADDVPARAVLEAIAAEIGADAAEATLRGEPVPADAPLSELALRWGDELRFGGAPTQSPPAAAELVVHGGPQAGRRIPLAAGVHRIGRDAAVTLDDPTLSGNHLVLTVEPDGTATVADAGSRNGTLLEGAGLEPGAETPLPAGALVRAGRTLFAVEPSRPAAAPEPVHGGLTLLNRQPRVRRPLEPRVRRIPAPPNDPQRARLPLGASLIPLVLGVGLYFVTHIPTMLFFSLLSPVMAVSTWIEDRRSGRKGFEQHSREYRERLVELQGELEDERAGEIEARRAESPSAAELVLRARRHDPRLWERRPGDGDFLGLRVGSADRASLLSLELEAGGSDELRREAERLTDWYATTPDVPVTVPAVDVGTIGICGPRECVDGLARWLVAQTAALHSPREVAIAAAVPDDESWRWVRWLPHADDEAGSPAPRVGEGPAGARAVFEELGRLVAARRGDEDSGGAAGRRRLPHVLLVVDEAVAPERSVAAGVLAAGDAGVTVIWLARERRDLPGEATVVLALDEASSRLTVEDTRARGEPFDASADLLSADSARELALALAPLRDAGGGLEQSVPQRVSLLDLLGADDPDADWVLARWDGAEGLGAPVGAAAGAPFAVDLRLDGPHGLVAGTTGAGKSELLQTMIASLAASHSPSRLTFLLVDYKGGTAFKDCERLPHTVGLVTDLDAHLTRRALQSLNAELQRRERVLRDADAKDLADLERRSPETAPPSLLIVIDEFATLAKEVPDFVEGVVDVAQRGRSLGVHLLLATQRPGGVVSENIRANTNLRIALRVNEGAESADVIGASDAARIARDRPGRAYARTGHGELTELQTAYCGGVTVHATLDEPVVVRRLGAARGASAAGGGDVPTDLARLVDATKAAAEARSLSRPRSPWLDPLPTTLALAAAPPEPGAISVGLIDEPSRQLQRPLALDLDSDGSVLVYGASGSGKTAFLRTLAVALAQRSSPAELHVYGLDFATRGLTPLAELPHVGAIVGGEDSERVERVFALVRKALERRKALFARAGVFSLPEYNATAETPEPRLLVLLDGYAGFAQAFERVNLGQLIDVLPRLVADGRPLGVHFAITADRRGAVPNALAGIVPTKLVLRMADEDEFAALGVEPRAVRGAHLPPGRGFLPGGVEFHAALGDVQDAVRTLGGAFAGHHAPAIEPLPTLVPRVSLQAAEDPWTATVGLADAELEPVRIDLRDRHLLVVGPYRSGRSTALATLVEGLRASTPQLAAHLLAPRRSPLAGLDGWVSVATGADCDDAALRLATELDPSRPALLVVDDGEELAESLGAPSLETLVRRGRDGALRIVASSERQGAQRAFAGWLRELRKEEHGLLLDPDPDVDGDLLGTRLPRRSNPVFPPGRGYLVERGVVELVQIAS